MESWALDKFTREPCRDGHNYNVVVAATDEPAVDLINLLEELRCNNSQTISIPTIDPYFTPSVVTYPSSIRLTWNEPSDCIGCEVLTDALDFNGEEGFGDWMHYLASSSWYAQLLSIVLQDVWL